MLYKDAPVYLDRKKNFLKRKKKMDRCVTKLICSLEDVEINSGLEFKKLYINQLCSVRFKTKQYFDNLVDMGKIREANPEELNSSKVVVPKFQEPTKIQETLNTEEMNKKHFKYDLSVLEEDKTSDITREDEVSDFVTRVKSRKDVKKNKSRSNVKKASDVVSEFFKEK